MRQAARASAAPGARPSSTAASASRSVALSMASSFTRASLPERMRAKRDAQSAAGNGDQEAAGAWQEV